jgi:hypothetical protein
MNPETATLLGAPLTDVATTSVLVSKSNQLKLFSSRLDWISSHSAYFLLKITISESKTVHCHWTIDSSDLGHLIAPLKLTPAPNSSGSS